MPPGHISWAVHCQPPHAAGGGAQALGPGGARLRSHVREEPVRIPRQSWQKRLGRQHALPDWPVFLALRDN